MIAMWLAAETTENARAGSWAVCIGGVLTVLIVMLLARRR